jgi:hypothetical protein
VRRGKLRGATSEHTTQGIIARLIGELHPVLSITTDSGATRRSGG